MCQISINQRFIFSVEYIISENIVEKKKDIADILGITPSKFSEILNERMNVSAELLSIFSIKFGISVEWLLTGEGEMIKLEDKKELNYSDSTSATNESPIKPGSKKCELCKEKDNQIADLKERILYQEQTIQALLSKIPDN